MEPEHRREAPLIVAAAAVQAAAVAVAEVPEVVDIRGEGTRKSIQS